MGETIDGLHGDSVDEDAVDLMNPRQGFFVEHFDSRLQRACQVWLRFQIDGRVQASWCVWSRGYTKKTAGEVRGQQEAFLLLFRQIAHTLNSGVDADEIREVVGSLFVERELSPSFVGDLLAKYESVPSINLPSPWFYWSSSFDYDSVDETAPICTHYFVQPGLDQCLVWQEDTYMEIVPCESVGLRWQEVQAAIDADFEEEVLDGQEAHTSSG